MSTYTHLITTAEVSKCLLCYDAKCSKACNKGKDPAKAIFSLKFKNKSVASEEINSNTCGNCEAPCEKACVHFDKPIRIKEIGESLEKSSTLRADLSIDFCGLKCENPFFLSSSVVASGYEMCAKALNMGWAGIVYKTIGFYEPKEVSPRFGATKDSNRSFVGFKNLEQISDKKLEDDLDVLRRLKKDFPSKIIVSSIMGQNENEWTELARLSEEAGCDIIECNFSCPHMSEEGLGSDVGQNPELVKLYTKATKKGTTLPIMAKMTPNIGNMEIPAVAAVEAGAVALAAINTIKSISDVKYDNLVSAPNVNGKSSVSGYSGRSVKPIALRFIADMANCSELKNIPISGMGGIENYKDAVDFISLGSSNIQITTAVMEYGYRIIDDLISGLSNYLADNKIDKLSDLVGKALTNICSAELLDRNTRVYPIFDKSKCTDCKRCYISCFDAGHQAIDIVDDKIKFISKKCVGCHLCRLVCPANAISESKRVKCGDR